jgi:hypothetical protein
VNSCDINCDGHVDFKDWGAAWCRFEARPSCCTQPTGACTGVVLGGVTFPPCVVTDEEACEDPLSGGTFHGSNTVCFNDEPVVVPTMSTWGLLVLVLLVMGGGTLIMSRSRLRSA